MKDFEFTRKQLNLSDGSRVDYFSLAALEKESGSLSALPFSLKILLESMIRMQEHPAYTPEHVESFAKWPPTSSERIEYPFMPTRILLQDFTGVPAVIDIAALRDALKRNGFDPALIEPEIPVDLVIDHSVQTDRAGNAEALDYNIKREFERNNERYRFLKWGQNSYKKLNVLPPGLGICHQINMEYLAKCVTLSENSGARPTAFPDSLVGTDSHTVMINSMGILGWGVGGIEAEAAMLGQPIPMLSPLVTGMHLKGAPRTGVTPTDIALHIVQMLRKVGVVGHFIEYFGEGVDNLSLTDRAPIANMAPEYGATMGFFPVDAATLRYLRETGRTEEHVDLVERYCKEQGLWRNPNATHSKYSGIVELDLSTVEPCVAGPRKPHERIPLGELGRQFREQLSKPTAVGGFDVKNKASRSNTSKLKDGDIVIASITSCTNTAIPSLILGAGLMARKAVEKGLRVPAHVKTSLAPGSHVAAAYLKNTDLLTPLETLGFNIVCYGCASCIGNSGPLPEEIESAIKMDDLIVTSVLSGNRNFEGRIHALTRANYLASPPLVLAFALAGTVDIDIQNDPIGRGFDGQLVYLTDIWPTPGEIEELLDTAANPELCRQVYSNISASSEMWEKLPAENSSVFEWEENSTYIREPSFFDGIDQNTPELREIRDAAVFGFYGDFITTDHISPAGAIPADSPAADYLASHGVTPAEFNSFGCRRGNHEVMMRGTLSNIRIRNKLVTHEGGWTLYHPAQKKMTMFDAAMKYKESNTPLIVLAGKMYGAGSSRDWAAKGTFLLGVRAVIAESFERIHRSNLVEMGVLPLEFTNGETPDSLGLTGSERFSIIGATSNLTPGNRLDVEAHDPENGNVTRFKVLNRIDTPIELEYYRHGGILQYVLRKIMKGG